MKYSALPLINDVSQPAVPLLDRLAHAPECAEFRQISHPVGKPAHYQARCNVAVAQAFLAAEEDRVVGTLESDDEAPCLVDCSILKCITTQNMAQKQFNDPLFWLVHFCTILQYKLHASYST
jgi:hypothetical protein